MARGKKSTTKSGGSGNVTVALNYTSDIVFDLPDGRKIRIAGNATNLKGKPQGHIPVGAYGFTTISAADWDAIQKLYGKMRIFKSGLCFASTDKASASDEAEEKSSLRHGREPVSTETVQTVKATE